MTDADVDDEPGFRRRKVSRTALRKLRARESDRVKAAKPPLASPPALPTARALSLPDNDASTTPVVTTAMRLHLPPPPLYPPLVGIGAGQHAGIAPSLNSAAAVRVGLEQAARMTATFMRGATAQSHSTSLRHSPSVPPFRLLTLDSAASAVFSDPHKPSPHPISRRPTP